MRQLCVCLSASESHPATAPPRPTSCRGRLVLQESSHKGSTSRSSQQSDCPFCKKVNFVYTSCLPSFHESDFGNRLSESEVNTPPAGKHHHQQFLSFLPCQPHTDSQFHFPVTNASTQSKTPNLLQARYSGHQFSFDGFLSWLPWLRKIGQKCRSSVSGDTCHCYQPGIRNGFVS